MKQAPPSTSPRTLHGFTLIELLTVIAIIAILMGLLFPAVSAVKETAKKAQAKNDLTQIVVAVKAYNTEYGKYPVKQEGAATVDKEFKASNSELMNVLRALDKAPNAGHVLNPRRTVFLEVKDAKNFNNPEKASGGIDDKGDFRDPWGETAGKGGMYLVRIDSNYDGQIDNPYATGAGQKELRTGVIAWTPGRDGDTSTTDKKSAKSEDDVISWQ